MLRGSLFLIDGALHIKHPAHAFDVALHCSSRMSPPRLREDVSDSAKSDAEQLIS